MNCHKEERKVRSLRRILRAFGLLCLCMFVCLPAVPASSGRDHSDQPREALLRRLKLHYRMYYLGPIGGKRIRVFSYSGKIRSSSKSLIKRWATRSRGWKVASANGTDHRTKRNRHYSVIIDRNGDEVFIIEHDHVRS
jgi:hypothetical protein